MHPYHKIKSIWARDAKGIMQPGQWVEPWMPALAAMEWTWTEKVDGTNIRVMLQDGKVLLGGRTDRAQLPVPLIQRLTYLFPEDRMVEVFSNTAEVCLYGEGYGAGIQKGGGNYGPSQDFILFDIMINGTWLDRSAVHGIANNLVIQTVPVRAQTTLYAAINMVRRGFDSDLHPVEAPSFQAEGLVGRPPVDLFDRHGDRIILKLKHRDFARMTEQTAVARTQES
jgi:hypothetical protein